MKLKYFLLALVIGSTTTITKAQDYDLGLFGGFAFYQGDLSPGLSNGLVNAVKGTRPAIGAIYRYNFHPNFSVRGNFNFGWIAAYDKYQNKGTSRESRNLSFNAPLLELSGQFEWNLRKYIAGSKKYTWTPYLFAGFGLTYSRPMAWYEGEMVHLKPLVTEQEKQGAAHAGKGPIHPVIPIGGGLKFNVKRDWTVGVEMGWRKMFTDYLDDVSGTYTGLNDGSMDAKLGNRTGQVLAPGTRRGNPTLKDSYFFYGITITKTLRKYSCN